ncbi:MAG TPA: hypothetical protein PK867_27305 [Pirellulales bacterium]|nr:hypothetical protein [Pirellulales bacterium]
MPLSRSPAALLMALVGLAVALRAPNLIDRDLWGDELIQYQISSAPSLPEVFSRLRLLDRNPPGYALLAHAALCLHHSDAMLRLPAVAGGMGAVVLAWYAGKLWLGLRGAVLLAALNAVAPSYVFYSCEARPYSLGIAAILWFLLCLGRFRRRATPSRAAFLAASATAAISVQYANLIAVAVVLTVTAAFSLASGRLTLRTAALGGAIAATTALAAALNIFAFMCPQIATHGTGNSDFLAPYFFELGSYASLKTFLTTNLSGFIGHTTFSEYMGHLSPAWHKVSLIGLLPLAGVLAAALRRGTQAKLIAALSLSTFLAFVLLAGVGAHPFGAVRHTLPLTPLLYLLYATGMVLLRRYVVSRAASGLAFLLLVVQMLTADAALVPGYMRFDYRMMQAHIAGKRRPREWVVVTGPLASPGLKHLSGSDRWDQVPWFYVPHSPRTPHEAAEIRGLLKEAFKNSSGIWFVEDLAPATDLRAFGAHCEETCTLSGVVASHWKQHVDRR